MSAAAALLQQAERADTPAGLSRSTSALPPLSGLADLVQLGEQPLPALSRAQLTLYTLQTLADEMSDDQPAAAAPATEDSSALTNPIPEAAKATSHVDQLSTSPPHPSNAFSPSISPEARDLNSPLAVIPSYAELQQIKKRHPADLVTSLNPDPHRSPPASPLDSPSPDAHLPLELPNSSAELSRDDSREDSRDENCSASDNGVTVGHGSEEGYGHHHSSTTDSPRAAAGVNGSDRRRSSSGALQEEDEEDAEERQDQAEALSSRPPTSIAAAEPSFAASSAAPALNGDSSAPLHDANGLAATPRKSAHGRSQSMASPSSSPRAPPSSSSPRQPSSSMRDPERSHRSSERRDRERERERDQQAAGSSRDREREKEQRESTRSRRTLGEWTMSKTLGAGSMGKVKLGISGITGEKVSPRSRSGFCLLAVRGFRPTQIDL